MTVKLTRAYLLKLSENGRIELVCQRKESEHQNNWTLRELPSKQRGKLQSEAATWLTYHEITPIDVLCVPSPPGQGSWQVASEMVRSWVYELLQILIQKWRVELWSAHVGGLLPWPETIQGMTNL